MTFDYSIRQLNVKLCVTCGQVFRWDVLEDGSLLGVDGDHWWHVDQKESLQITGDETSFASLFRLDEDFESMEAAIRCAAPELEPYILQLSGLRLLRPSRVDEEMFCFLCTPNNNLTRINSMVRHLASYGEPMDEFEGRAILRFPSLETIADLPEAELRTRGFGYRAATIPAIARQVLERGGVGWLESLKTKTYEEARIDLISLKGVGPKLADCIALFALHHTEAVPVDTHLWQAAVRLYFPEFEGKSLTDQRYQKVGDHFRAKFGKLAGWAHQYLFFENLLNWRNR